MLEYNITDTYFDSFEELIEQVEKDCANYPEERKRAIINSLRHDKSRFQLEAIRNNGKITIPL